MIHNPRPSVWRLAALALAASCVGVVLAAETVPPLPVDVPVLMVGHPDVVPQGKLPDYKISMAMGRATKDNPLAVGEAITPGAIRTSVLERVTVDGREVLRRSMSVRRPGDDQVLARASIDLDPQTLLPLRSQALRGGVESTIEYDWETFVVRSHPGGDAEPTEIPLDMKMFEVGTHDIWLAALPLRDGYTARLPMIFASTGVKYWAVPRVVGSERVDVGDGTPREAWVVEMNWWGMGAANVAENYSTGAGKNGSGGAGGKYWVLKKAVPGMSRVVRVRTEIDGDSDSVIQLQAGL